MTTATAKFGVVCSVIAVLLLTVLEFPSPIGFETRPQTNVSLFWLGFFMTIVITEVATIPFIYKLPKLGAKLGLTAAVLNILQVIADQAHLMQPEVAPLNYSLLEGTVVLASLALAYCSWKVLRTHS